MRKEVTGIFKEEITLPAVVLEKAGLAFEEIKNRENDFVKKATIIPSESFRGKKFRITPAWAALIILAICILVPTGIVVAKGVKSLYQRMQRTTTEEWLGKHAAYSAIPAATCGYSRELTQEESARYEELLIEYQTTDISPEYQIRYVGEKNDGEIGNVFDEGLIMWLEGDNLVIELPAVPMSDEHLLELIDFEQQISYSMRRNNMVNAVGGVAVWKNLEDLTQEEIEEYYLIYYGANLHTSGGYNRRLTAKEQARFAELKAAYEAGSAHPQVEVAYIDKPEQFTGEQVVFCLSDECYYLPKDMLNDEELLQIIDLDKKHITASFG